MADTVYQDPPAPLRWSYDAFRAGPGDELSVYHADLTRRPAHVTQTPSGPMATGALPDGMDYDMYGNIVYTDGNGDRWTWDAEGRPARIEYSGALPGGIAFAPGGLVASGPSQMGPTITPATDEEIKADKVPQVMLSRQYRREVNAAVAEATASTKHFGTTSPGSTADIRPAAMGGPLNANNWLGSDALRAQMEAQHPDWTPDEIENAVLAYSRTGVVRQASRKYYDKGQAGTYYQRAALDRAVAEGYGRPQYAAGYEYAVYKMSKESLLNLQLALKQAKIPGSSSIVLGQVGSFDGEDATVLAYRNALAQANLAGVPIDTYLSGQVKAAKMAERAGLEDGSPGDPRFDPTRVQTVVNLTGKARARAQLKQMMTAMLGRAPSESEVNDYLDRLNDRERSDPTVVTTTYTRSGDSSRTTEQTDVDPVQIGENLIKSDNPKEYEAQQRARYYNVLLQMVGSS